MTFWALRAARREPVLSGVMVAALTNAVAFWLIAEAAHSVETRHLTVERPALYRALLKVPEVWAPGLEAWLPQRWAALLWPSERAEALRRLAPDTVVATFAAPLPVRTLGSALAERSVRFTTRALFEAFDRPLLEGRPWSPAADEDASVREAVVRQDAARVWLQRDDVLGQTVELDGRPFTIVGTLAKGDGQPYDLSFAADGDELLVPWAQAAELKPSPQLATAGGGQVNVWALLPAPAPDVLATLLPNDVSLMPYAELWRRASLEDPAVDLFRAFALIALAACAFSVMRLLSARFLQQAPAHAVRRALGATRLSLFGALSTQALTLGAAAAVLAPPVAWLGTAVLNRFMLNRVGDYRIDAHLAATGAAVALCTAVLAGLWPALKAARAAPAAHLRSQ